MRKHIRFACELGWEKCHQCNLDSHPDLFVCTVCNGAEGQLTTECPGILIPEYKLDAVMAGIIDFKDGEWIVRFKK